MDDFVLSSKQYRDLLIQLKDAEAYGKDADKEINALSKENIKLKGYLEDAGWRRCDIPACNCGGYHRHNPSHLRED